MANCYDRSRVFVFYGFVSPELRSERDNSDFAFFVFERT